MVKPRADAAVSLAWPLRIFGARPRLYICAILGIATGLIVPATISVVPRALIGWNIAVACYLVSSSIMMMRATHESIRERAKLLDDGRFIVLSMATLAAIGSLVGIVLVLGGIKDLAPLSRGLHVALAGSTIVMSWFFIHMMFAQLYAHEYYAEQRGDRARKAEFRGGLMFPGTDKPHYTDFLYFSYIIGVASQTADVATTSATMRGMSLAHSILAFFFNTTVLALTINIAASLI